MNRNSKLEKLEEKFLSINCKYKKQHEVDIKNELCTENRYIDTWVTRNFKNCKDKSNKKIKNEEKQKQICNHKEKSKQTFKNDTKNKKNIQNSNIIHDINLIKDPSSYSIIQTNPSKFIKT